MYHNWISSFILQCSELKWMWCHRWLDGVLGFPARKCIMNEACTPYLCWTLSCSWSSKLTSTVSVIWLLVCNVLAIFLFLLLPWIKQQYELPLYLCSCHLELVFLIFFIKKFHYKAITGEYEHFVLQHYACENYFLVMTN